MQIACPSISQNDKPITEHELNNMMQVVAEHENLTQRYVRVMDYWQKHVLPGKASNNPAEAK